MPHNIRCYEFDFPEDDSVTKILFLLGEPPFKLSLIIFDDLGKRIVPYPHISSYMKRFDHHKNRPEYKNLFRTYRKIQQMMRESGNQNLYQSSNNANIQMPPSSEYRFVSSDEAYAHLSVDLDNPWFDVNHRRELVLRVAGLDASQVTVEDSLAYEALLNDTALPLLLEGYQVSGYNRRLHFTLGDRYDPHINPVEERDRFNYHCRLINAETAKVIRNGNRVSIGFCCATLEDKVLHCLVADNIESSSRQLIGFTSREEAHDKALIREVECARVYDIGTAQPNGDALFDAFAQGFAELHQDAHALHPVYLRQLCQRVAENPPEWLVTLFEAQGLNVERYRYEIQFTGEAVALSGTLEGLIYQPVDKDGHCFFQALSYYLDKPIEEIRSLAADYLEQHPGEFCAFAEGYGQNPEKFVREYVNGRVGIRGTRWGSQLEITALQRILKRPIIVIEQRYSPVIPENIADLTGDPIYLFFNGDNHYNALILDQRSNARTILNRIQASENIRLTFRNARSIPVISGRPEIEGRILSDYLNVTIEVHRKVGNELIRECITPEGASASTNPIRILQDEDHFVPLREKAKPSTCAVETTHQITRVQNDAPRTYSRVFDSTDKTTLSPIGRRYTILRAGDICLGQFNAADVFFTQTFHSPITWDDVSELAPSQYSPSAGKCVVEFDDIEMELNRRRFWRHHGLEQFPVGTSNHTSLNGTRPLAHVFYDTLQLSYDEQLRNRRFGFEDYRIAGIDFHIENERALRTVNEIVPPLFESEHLPEAARRVLELGRKGVESGRIKINVFDADHVMQDTNAYVSHYADGSKEIFFQARNKWSFYTDFFHEITHATTSSAFPGASSHAYAAEFRHSYLSSYWEYRKIRHTLTPDEKTYARWIYEMPLMYPKESRAEERFAFTMTALAASANEGVIAKICPYYLPMVNWAVAQEAYGYGLPNYSQGFPEVTKLWDVNATRSYMRAPYQLGYDGYSPNSPALIRPSLLRPRPSAWSGPALEYNRMGSLYLGQTTELHTFPIRPAITEGRGVPFYSRVNWGNVGNLALNVGCTGLLAYDTYRRFEHELASYPLMSSTAHLGAVSAGLSWDLGSHAGLATAMGSSWGAAAVLIPIHILSEYAHAIRDVDPKTVGREIDSDFFYAREFLFPRSFLHHRKTLEYFIKQDPFTRQFLADDLYRDFDNGGSWSHQYVVDKVRWKQYTMMPFRFYHDLRAGFIDTSRTVVQCVDDFLNRPIVGTQDNALIRVEISDERPWFWGGTDFSWNLSQGKRYVEDNAAAENSSRQAQAVEAASIPAQPADPCIEQPSDPLLSFIDSLEAPISNNAANMGNLYANGPVSFVDKGNGRIEFQVPANNNVFSSEFHSFLMELNRNRNDNAVVTQGSQAPQNNTTPEKNPTPLRYQPKSQSKAVNGEEKPLPMITNSGLSIINGGIGFFVELYASGVLTFEITATSFSFSIGTSAAFGPAFWSTIAPALGVGLAIAAVGLTVQYLYTKHLEKIAKKLLKDIDATNWDIKAISKLLDQISKDLQNEVDYNTLNSHIREATRKLEGSTSSEMSRARYADKHGKRQAGEQHRKVAKEYDDSINNLADLAHQALLNEERKRFIGQNKGLSDAELVELAKSLTGTVSNDDRDETKILGVRDLIINRAMSAALSGDADKVRDLLLQVRELTYYVKGDLKTINIGQHLGIVDPITQMDIDRINGQLVDINETIGRGDDPSDAIKNLIKDVQTTIPKWRTRRKERRLYSRPGKKYYVHGSQWDDRIKILSDLERDLQRLLLEYVEGNLPKDFNLSVVSSTLEEFCNHLHEPPEFWYEMLSAMEADKKNEQYTEEKKSITKALIGQHIINLAMHSFLQGKFDEGCNILETFCNKQPELAESSKAAVYLEVFQNLTPYLNQPIEVLLDHYKEEINLINSRPSPKRQNKKAREKQEFQDDIALSMIENLIYLDIQKEICCGHFEEAIVKLNKLREANPEMQNEVTLAIEMLEEWKGHYGDVHFCLQRLREREPKQDEADPKEQQQSENDSADDPIAYSRSYENTLIYVSLTNEILQLAKAGKKDEAKALLEDYQKCAPQADLKGYDVIIEEVYALHDKPISDIINRFAELKNEAGNHNEKLKHALENMITERICKFIVQGNLEEAKEAYIELIDKDPEKKQKYDRCIATIVYCEENRSETVEALLAKKAELQAELDQLDLSDDKARECIEAQLMILRSEALNVVYTLARKGWNRKAADELKSLADSDNDTSPETNNNINDLRYAHYGQFLGVFTKVLQQHLAQCVQEWEPSGVRTGCMAALEVVNTVQIFAPNAAPMLMQTLFELCTTGTASASGRAAAELLSQLSKDLNPFDANYNPFNVDSYCSGAMTYVQLVLKGAQHIPFEQFVSEENFERVAKLRSDVLYYGGVGVNIGMNVNALLQLRQTLASDGRLIDLSKPELFTRANTPLQLATLASSMVDFSYELYHRYKEGCGEGIEDQNHYLQQLNAVSFLNAMGNIAFVCGIWGGLGPISIASAIVLSYATVSNMRAKSTNSLAATKALKAAISNIAFCRVMQGMLQEQLQNEGQLFDLLDKPFARDQTYAYGLGDYSSELRRELASGKTICFSREGERSCYLFVRTGRNTVSKIPIEDIPARLEHTYRLVIQYYYQRNLLALPVTEKVDGPVRDQGYTTRCTYVVMMGTPTDEIDEQIQRGKIICLSVVTDERKLVYRLHFKTCAKKVGQIVLPNNSLSHPHPCFGALTSKKQLFSVSPEHGRYDSLARYATKSLITHFVTKRSINPGTENSQGKVTHNKQSVQPYNGYVDTCRYTIILGMPSDSRKQDIADGNEICFSKEDQGNPYCFTFWGTERYPARDANRTVYSYYMYIRNRQGKLEKVELKSPPPWFKLLSLVNEKANLSFEEKTFGEQKVISVVPADEGYREISEFVITTLLDHYLLVSRNNLGSILLNSFSGKMYDSRQDEVVNQARLFQLSQEVQDAYDIGDYERVIQITKLYRNPHSGETFVNKDYRIPTHLAIQLILGFHFRVLLESDLLFRDFPSHYREYCKAIYESAKTSKDWFKANWNNVQKSLRAVLQTAFRRFILAAFSTRNLVEKSEYLANVTCGYVVGPEESGSLTWDALLTEDVDYEIKFYAAMTCQELGMKDEEQAFMGEVEMHYEALGFMDKKYFTKLVEKPSAQLTSIVLTRVHDVDETLFEDLLFSVTRQSSSVPVDDRLLFHCFIRKIDAGDFEYVRLTWIGSKEFAGKETAWLYYLFEAFHKTRMLDVLYALFNSLKDESSKEVKDAFYWELLLRVLLSCRSMTVNSLVSAGEQTTPLLLLNSLIVNCLNVILSLRMFPSAKLQDFVKIKQRLDGEINSHIQYQSFETQRSLGMLLDDANRAFTECNAMELYAKISNILSVGSLEFQSGNNREVYLPISANSDYDSAFHILGTNRKNGLALVRDYVYTTLRIWDTTFQRTYGCGCRKNVIGILHDGFKESVGVTTESNTDDLKSSVERAKQLLLLLKDYEEIGVPNDPRGHAILKVLAFLLKIHLKLFEIDTTNNKLKLRFDSCHSHENSPLQLVTMLWSQEKRTFLGLQELKSSSNMPVDTSTGAKAKAPVDGKPQFFTAAKARGVRQPEGLTRSVNHTADHGLRPNN